MLPSLQKAILHDASLPGVPVEILSKDQYQRQLSNRLRAHLADLTGDDDAVGDVKLMILGNGRVGKTQICRRLRGESFDEAVPSTHGVQVSSAPLAHGCAGQAGDAEDMGFRRTGYLSWHACAVPEIPRDFPTRVDAASPRRSRFHTHGGFTFRNQPLAYWLAYVRTFGGAAVTGARHSIAMRLP